MTSPTFSIDGADVETGDVEQLAAAQAAAPLAELGATGLKRAAGYLDEEFLPALRGRKAIAVYREMADNCAPIGGMLLAIDRLVRDVDWTVTPAGPSARENAEAKFIESCLDDMSTSWADVVGEALSCAVYGWSWHEVVYKVRGGLWTGDGRTRSKYNDGLIGWRKMPIRSQDSWQRWVFDAEGGVQGMVQMPPPTYRQIALPISRSLLFRFGTHKGSPEGRSMLRAAYQAWFYLKRLQEGEAIGVERDLAGLPIAKVPASYLSAKVGTPEQKMVMSMTKLVRSVRRNEKEGLVFPTQVNEDTKADDFDFSLLGSGGSRQHDTDALITRYKTDILMSCLADFLLVGHQETGTYNMHLDKTGMFKATLNATVNMIADVINRHAIPRLFEINQWRPAALPKLTPSDIDAPNLTELAGFLSATANLGFAWGPDEAMDDFLRKAANLPERSESAKNRERTIARRADAVRFMQGQTDEIAARQALAQAKATEALGRAGVPSMDQMQLEQGGAPAQPGQQGGQRQLGAGAPGQPAGQNGPQRPGSQPRAGQTQGGPGAR